MNEPFEIINGSVTKPIGFRACGFHCGIKKTDRYDLGAIVSDVPASAAAVFTLNQIQAAPIKITKETLAHKQKIRAVVVNSGNANACTGIRGEEDARRMRQEMANVLGFSAYDVVVASTGVIGEPLPIDTVLQGIHEIPSKLGRGGADDFAHAILTTDLVQKEACVQVKVDGRTVCIGGVAKGSGMIEPNMATMLGFITTDANIDPTALTMLLRQVTDKTFNMITVDGDTSTNDMVLVMANGMAENECLHPEHKDWQAFAEGLQYVAEQLAKAIARDGEGATKLVEVRIEGAETDEAARAIAKTVIGSSLVKSAIFGADANWGRIIAAVGRAGHPIRPDTIDIRIGEIIVLQQSVPQPVDEEAAERYLKESDTIEIVVNLHMGNRYAISWGCDLTYEYVRINAAYRT